MSQAHARALTTRQEATVEQFPVRQTQSEVQKKRRLDPAVIVSIGAVIVLIAALAHVAQRAEVAVLTYELQRENLRLAQAERMRNHLLVEVAKTRSLGDIEIEARERLGMVDPDRVRWLTVASGDAPVGGTADATETKLTAPLVSAVATWYERVRSELGDTP